MVIDYSNSVGIGGDLGIVAPDSLVRTNRSARDSFQYFSLIGSFMERRINQDQGINFEYQEGLLSYQFKGALICKKPGLYALAAGDNFSAGLRGKNCTNANFITTVTNSRKNINLYENALGISLDTDAIARIYVFKIQ